MKKNNKGFFLAETIVMIALITTVMAFVYPNVAKLYENYKNKASYYDQTEDIYTLKAVYDYLLDEEIIAKETKEDEIAGCKIFSENSYKKIVDDKIKIGGLDELYITGYMTKISDKKLDYEFKKYLNRMKKTTFDTASYRLIGIFKEGNKVRYASIKVDNPNPNRNCNLGGGNNGA